MSATTSVSELAAALAVVAPALVTARVVGRRRLPSWDGAPRLLASITVAITALMLAAHVAGALGWLRPLPIAGVGVAIALGACALPARGRAGDELPAPPHAGRGPVLVMLVAIAVVCGQWATRVAAAYQRGIGDYDSLHYHLPHAARF